MNCLTKPLTSSLSFYLEFPWLTEVLSQRNEDFFLECFIFHHCIYCRYNLWISYLTRNKISYDNLIEACFPHGKFSFKIISVLSYLFILYSSIHKVHPFSSLYHPLSFAIPHLSIFLPFLCSLPSGQQSNFPVENGPFRNRPRVEQPRELCLPKGGPRKPAPFWADVAPLALSEVGMRVWRRWRPDEYWCKVEWTLMNFFLDTSYLQLFLYIKCFVEILVSLSH